MPHTVISVLRTWVDHPTAARRACRVWQQPWLSTQTTFSRGFQDGYYVDMRRQKFDFHDSTLGQSRGLAVASQTSLGQETKISFDTFWFLPVEVRNPAGLKTVAVYDYRVFQPKSVTDPNGNRKDFTFTPLGLLATSSVRGKTASEGDQARAGST